MKYKSVRLMVLLFVFGLSTAHPLHAGEWWEGTFVTQRFVSAENISLAKACDREEEVTMYRRNSIGVPPEGHGCQLSEVKQLKSLDVVILHFIDCWAEGTREPTLDGSRLLMRYSRNRVLEYQSVGGEAVFRVLLRCPE